LTASKTPQKITNGKYNAIYIGLTSEWEKGRAVESERDQGAQDLYSAILFRKKNVHRDKFF